MISFVAMTLQVIVIVLFFFYSLLMIYYWSGWHSLDDFRNDSRETNTGISVIIPARNEEKNIGKLLEALQKQDLPETSFEVIVVNDHSTDQTAEIVKQFFSVRLLELQKNEINSYKKKAIGDGIAISQKSFIVTTDADCLPPTGWLKTIAEFREKNNSLFIAAPVIYSLRKKNFLAVFQALDFLTLQGVTAVSVHKKLFPMCNGANLGYDKNAFYETGGFKSIDQVASGDDMLLMQKVNKKFPGSVHYVKSKQAIVETEPADSWKNFFNQRLRWASKARFYNNSNILLVQLLVYLFNLSFFALLIAAIWNIDFLLWFVALWLAKTIIELPFVYSVAAWFNQRSLVRWFFLFQPLHIVYTVSVGLLSQFVKYEWKGRRVR